MDRVHKLLSMLLSDSVAGQLTQEEVKTFLDKKVKQKLLAFTGGVYKKPKWLMAFFSLITSIGGEVVGLRDVAFSDVRIPSFSRFEKFVGRFRYQTTGEERRRQILMAAYSSVDVWMYKRGCVNV